MRFSYTESMCDPGFYLPLAKAAEDAGFSTYLVPDSLCYISPWPEDFAATFQKWETRGARTDEMIDIIRGLMRGDYYEYHGEHYALPRLKLCPVPSAPVPILVGGHSEAALRRAARLGDGWMHAGGSPDDFSRLLARLQTLRAEFNREREPFEIHAGSADAYTLDGARRLADQGVTDVVVGFRNPYTRAPDTQPLEKKLALLRGYADRVIARY